jgi:hypothetical protein
MGGIEIIIVEGLHYADQLGPEPAGIPTIDL